MLSVRYSLLTRQHLYSPKQVMLGSNDHFRTFMFYFLELILVDLGLLVRGKKKLLPVTDANISGRIALIKG